MAISFEDKLRIVCGQGKWHTAKTPSGPAQIHVADGPHGVRSQAESAKSNNDSVIATCFPTASAIAASFDTEAAAKMAFGIAKEAKQEEVSVILGPGVNIKRSPLCGRNFEYYSEDPFLAGKLASSFVRAMQSEGVGTSLKHFAGNSQETHRMTSNSEIDDRALFEIYLAAFEMVVKEANPATIMASYNRLNGSYACENKRLLTDILRTLWGYRGTVISDWGACTDLPASIKAGMDLAMPDNASRAIPVLKKAIEDGLVSEEELDKAAEHVADLCKEYGYAGKRPKNGISQTALLNENGELAATLAAQTAVLLRNENNTLPLSGDSEVLVIGELATNMRYQGGGSSHIHVLRSPDALRVMTSFGMSPTYAQGYKSKSIGIDKKLLREAVDKVKNSDCPILFFGGLTEWAEGEGYDRDTLDMPVAQITLLKEIEKVLSAKEKRNPFIFLSFGGAPYDMSPADFADAIVHMYPAGEGMDSAIVRILLGQACPCGHLPETWPLHKEDIPCHETYATGSDDVEYRESIFVGYRYYDTYKIPVRYPFGYGLSYTSFAYTNAEVRYGDSSYVNYDGNGKLLVSFDITNTGSTDGADVVQLYVKAPSQNFLRPTRELRAFTKVFLKAGETKRVTLELNDRSFSIYDTITASFVMPSGIYELEIGNGLHNLPLSIPVEISGCIYSVDDRIRYSEYFLQKHDFATTAGPIPFHISAKQFAKLYGKELSSFDEQTPGDFDMRTGINKLAKYSFLARCLRVFIKFRIHLMLKGVKKQDPEYRMFLESSLDGTLYGATASGGYISEKLGQKILSEANKQ